MALPAFTRQLLQDNPVDRDVLSRGELDSQFKVLLSQVECRAAAGFGCTCGCGAGLGESRGQRAPRWPSRAGSKTYAERVCETQIEFERALQAALGPAAGITTADDAGSLSTTASSTASSAAAADEAHQCVLDAPLLRVRQKIQAVREISKNLRPREDDAPS